MYLTSDQPARFVFADTLRPDCDEKPSGRRLKQSQVAIETDESGVSLFSGRFDGFMGWMNEIILTKPYAHFKRFAGGFIFRKEPELTH
jgi:hypothetical protein